MEAMDKRYDASVVEQKWYARWEEAGLFAPETNSTKPSYVITIPPPNITGALHMGHALCYPIQDLLGRYYRSRGRNVLILPGQDHAGIATQSVVEKLLRKEGSSGAKIGREAFLQRTWEWREESGDTILNQFRRLGCAFDWSRSRFTLDEGYVRAVLKVFIDWFDRGLIYRGKRVVNWDPVLKTSVSDIETERKVTKGKLYHIRYPFVDGSGEVVIATTRPETMLADVAVAVHPSDERYKGLVGKMLTLPLVGREIPLISDIYPDPEFGTGAVKITPAHDPNDYQVGVRHSLPMPVLLDESARVTEDGGAYAGLDRYEARKRIVADLEEQGFLVKVDDHELALIVSERSGEVIEPLLSEQWFANQSELAKPVIEAMKANQIKFVPERYDDIFTDWLSNVHEWCLSRQLWWGHRIPVFYTEDGRAVAAQTWEEAEQKAGEKVVRQDDDVLDTWFSSGLWTFATMGWPDDDTDLKQFHPTDCLVTSREIIYLWVARMAMTSLDFVKEIPFKEVFIYATVLTEDGRRMSKSLGTGVDPMTIIDSKGADVLRYTLLSQTGYNQDIRYSDKRTDEARNFCNKIWNAVRFVLMNHEGEFPARPTELAPEDQWLLSRLAACEEICRKGYDSYHIQEVCQALYKFFWNELCDWYIEISKHRLTDPAQSATPRWVLFTALEAFLVMMHPVMPHITEEIYAALPLPNKSPFVMSAPWPEHVAEFRAMAESEARVERWFAITRSLRALRAALNLEPGKTLETAYVEGDLQGGDFVVSTQAWFKALTVGRPEGKFVSATVEGVDLHLPLGEGIDLDKLRASIARETENATVELKKLRERIDNPMFAERAKPEVIVAAHSQAKELEERLAKLSERALLLQD
jgi:valyl-tRNA synthetase